MDYCHGETLERFLSDQGHLEPSIVRHLFTQLMSALAHMHSKNIAHRDLKLQNIIVGPNLELTIIDFGFSSNTANELSSTFCGSPAYFAPECARHMKYIPRFSDIWSAGVVLFLMLTNRFPWMSDNVPQMLSDIARGHVDIPSEVPLFWRLILQAMLRVDPEERATAEEILAMLIVNETSKGEPENHHRRVGLPKIITPIKHGRLIKNGSTPNNLTLLRRCVVARR